jgi:signal transduction histidine kinase
MPFSVTERRTGCSCFDEMRRRCFLRDFRRLLSRNCHFVVVILQDSCPFDTLVWLIDTSQSTVQDLRLRVGQVAEAMLQGIQHSVTIDGIDEKLRLSIASRRYIHLSIKEILHNIVQHAQATKVSITFSSIRNQIRVQIHANGHGFYVNDTSRGHGLKSLRRRAATFHGTIHIVSNPEKGTTVELLCPINRSSRFLLQQPVL